MPDPIRRSACLISAEYALSEGLGGVQRCTREYVAALEAAGFQLSIAAYGVDRRPLTRLQRRFAPRPYANLISPDYIASVRKQIETTRPTWVFFNQIEAAQIAPALGSLRSDRIRFALLSHGVDSSDYLHTARVFAPGSPSDRERWLGRQLFAEMDQHRHFDVVFCLSETDRLFHQWLGGRAVHFVPRIVESQPIAWRPVDGRVGTVGTLDHAPNFEGIDAFCAAVKRSGKDLRLRLVGRPEVRGLELARRHACIDYLGGIGDDEFTAEAQTWSAFVNPIFCYARGCSTKLAVPLGWHLPTASTRAGARGYRWDESLLPLAETPDELVALAIRLAQDPSARAATAALANASPKLPEVTALIRAALED